MATGRIIKLRTAEPKRLVLPRIGSLKIGIKNAKGYPQSVDYFIPQGKYAGLFTEAYGERPQTIQIVFPADDPGLVCSERYEYRDDSGALIAFGDGVSFSVWDGKKYETLLIDDYPNLMDSVAHRYPNRQARSGGDGWAVTLTLTFIAPLVRGVAGVWTFSTKGSASTIPTVRNTFDAVKEQRGFCKGIIFDLDVKFAKSQKPNAMSRYPVVTLVPNESPQNITKVKNALDGENTAQKVLQLQK